MQRQDHVQNAFDQTRELGDIVRRGDARKEHHHRRDRGDHRQAHRTEQPLFPLGGGIDVGLQVLRAGDGPGLRVSHPVAVHQEPVDEVHHEQYDQQLPEALPEPPRAVDRVHEHQHVGHVAGDTQRLERRLAAPYLLMGGQPQGHAALLHLRLVQMHHAHRAVADAEGTHQHQQSAQTESLQNNSPYHAVSLPFSGNNVLHKLRPLLRMSRPAATQRSRPGSSRRLHGYARRNAP